MPTKKQYWRYKKACPDCGDLISKNSNRCHPCSRIVLRKRPYPDGVTQSEKASIRNHYLHIELRGKVFAKLGDKCSVCGFDDIRALQVDHINNDGYKHRKDEGNYKKRLKSFLNDEEGKYQILCANCNFIKKHEVLTEKLEIKYGFKSG